MGLAERPKVGQTLEALVLFSDPDFDCLELTADPETIRKVSKKYIKKEEEGIGKEGQVLKATVVLKRTGTLYFEVLFTKKKLFNLGICVFC